MDANTIVKSQYAYINTANRSSGSQPCFFGVDITPAIKCEENERLSISIVSFKLTRSWNWLNATNNILYIQNTANYLTQTVPIPIPVGNYTYRKLASTITKEVAKYLVIPTDFKCTYNSSTNQFSLVGAASLRIMFNTNNSIGPALGFTKTDFNLGGAGRYYTSDSNIPLTIDKASEFRMYIENVITSNTAVNYENDTNSRLEPSNCVFVMRADIQPGSTYYVTAQEILFQLDVDEKQITKLVFSLRDEKGNLVDYAPDYLFTLRIDTIRTDMSALNEQVVLLKELIDYQRLQFVGANIDTV